MFDFCGKNDKYTMRELIDLIEGQNSPYLYVTCCVDGGHGGAGEAIHDMVDKSVEITYGTFLKYVGPKQIREVFPSYGHGLTLGNDYHVRFHKSRWYGIPCVFVVHSAIEYIFTQNGNTPESLGIDREEYLLDLD
jgi:hypothetical protein